MRVLFVLLLILAGSLASLVPSASAYCVTDDAGHKIVCAVPSCQGGLGLEVSTDAAGPCAGVQTGCSTGVSLQVVTDSGGLGCLRVEPSCSTGVGVGLGSTGTCVGADAACATGAIVAINPLVGGNGLGCTFVRITEPCAVGPGILHKDVTVRVLGIETATVCL